MENRFQHIFLNLKLALASLLLLGCQAWAQEEQQPPAGDHSDQKTINNEIFELGVAVGVINIADFNGEFTTGVSATFRASEDFFLQYNLLQADASASAYERSQGKLFDDRTFLHYDLLVGYNILQGEFFPSGPKARLSALYLVGGVGDTQFGGEDSFTYTVGVGYQIALTRRLIARFDYRSYLYTSNLIADENKQVNSTQFSSGLSFLF
jgi:outer membrane beta-barrel protein